MKAESMLQSGLGVRPHRQQATRNGVSNAFDLLRTPMEELR